MEESYHQQPSDDDNPDTVTIDAGGEIVRTTLSTLCMYPDSVLGRMFAPDNNSVMRRCAKGRVFMDCDARYLREVLQRIRRGTLDGFPKWCDEKSWTEELAFWGLSVLEERPTPASELDVEAWQMVVDGTKFSAAALKGTQRLHLHVPFGMAFMSSGVDLAQYFHNSQGNSEGNSGLCRHIKDSVGADFVAVEIRLDGWTALFRWHGREFDGRTQCMSVCIYWPS
jgi:hypothetical protein